jgi:alkylation response protein AidB-like acyl-CoA dehydrogenase
MPRVDPAKPLVLERDKDTTWQRERELPRLFHDGGFAGICFPREYGGLGLTYDCKMAFDAESVYEKSIMLNIPSFAICCATILDMGSEEQKHREHSADRGVPFNQVRRTKQDGSGA